MLNFTVSQLMLLWYLFS